LKKLLGNEESNLKPIARACLLLRRLLNWMVLLQHVTKKALTKNGPLPTYTSHVVPRKKCDGVAVVSLSYAS
jgi:hypothetical protein